MLFAQLTLAIAFPQSHPLWGDLEPGPHPVGFSSSFVLDASRSFQMTFEDGTKYAPEPGPRPILVNVWYPADASERDVEPMLHGDYLDLTSDDGERDERVERFADALIAYERRVIATELFGSPERSLSASDRDRLDELLETPTACRRDALVSLVLEGRRPLVVYHSGYGSSFEDNAVLCEYLASHGYVVAGSAFQTADGSSFNVDSREGTARDVERIVTELRAREDVDAERVAMVGHSGGAHATLRLRARPDSVLDALVSLDTTQDYYSILDPRWDHVKPVLEHPEWFSVPILFCANPHAFFDLADLLQAAPRWYFTTSLGHNDFIAQGVLAAEIAARRAPADRAAVEHARRVRAEYSALCRFVRTFLDAHLKEDEDARRRLDREHRDTPLGTGSHVEFAPAGTVAPPAYAPDLPDPPTPRQLRPLLEANGAAASAEILRRAHRTHPGAPVYEPNCGFALVYELMKRGRTDDARTLGAVWRELVPEFTAQFDAIGRFMAANGNKEYAVECFEALLVVDPENEDARKRLTDLRGK